MNPSIRPKDDLKLTPKATEKNLFSRLEKSKQSVTKAVEQPRFQPLK